MGHRDSAQTRSKITCRDSYKKERRSRCQIRIWAREGACILQSRTKERRQAKLSGISKLGPMMNSELSLNNHGDGNNVKTLLDGRIKCQYCGGMYKNRNSLTVHWYVCRKSPRYKPKHQASQKARIRSPVQTHTQLNLQTPRPTMFCRRVGNAGKNGSNDVHHTLSIRTIPEQFASQIERNDFKNKSGSFFSRFVRTLVEPVIRNLNLTLVHNKLKNTQKRKNEKIQKYYGRNNNNLRN